PVVAREHRWDGCRNPQSRRDLSRRGLPAWAARGAFHLPPFRRGCRGDGEKSDTSRAAVRWALRPLRIPAFRFTACAQRAGVQSLAYRWGKIVSVTCASVAGTGNDFASHALDPSCADRIKFGPVRTQFPPFAFSRSRAGP